MEQTITWSPTLQDLCEKYELEESVCDENTAANRNFEFSLICKVEQEGYFETENDRQTAEVVVEVSGSSTNKFTYSVAIALLMLTKVLIS